MATPDDAPSTTTTNQKAPSGLVGPIITGGFGTAVLMWLAWYGAHFPGLELSSARVAVAMMVALVIGTGYTGFLVGPATSGRVGLGAGALAGALDLLVLMASLVTQPSQGEAGRVPPNAAL
jgi:hypothetical protein